MAHKSFDGLQPDLSVADRGAPEPMMIGIHGPLLAPLVTERTSARTESERPRRRALRVR